MYSILTTIVPTLLPSTSPPLPSPTSPATSQLSYSQVHSVNDRLIERAIAVGGTCTGEHGVGVGKKKYLRMEHGDRAVDLMQTIKRALDPHNIMNPGKVVDI